LALSGVGLCLLMGTSAAPVAARLQQVDAPATLIAIRAASHPEETPRYDRVVFEFHGRLPENIRVEYVPRLIADGSGAVIPVRGNAILKLTVFPASAHSENGNATVPGRISYNLPVVTEIVRSCDFEAVVSYGIGLSHKTEFRFSTLTDPTRIVLDFFP
jgi:hypothetical protein